jgi:alkanesulfonate monooxygenase SsuD/methylene tetrahydromethanopterin reductase-like flavin-dependent oxidoreductase (luciferase family)
VSVELGVFVTPVADPAAVLEEVLAAERGGLELVGIQDHPYQRRFLDTFSLIAFLAARTERVRMFPAVANLPLRRPAMLAKAAVSIDVLSGGRFELGLGAGAFWDAIESFGGERRDGPRSVDDLEAAIPILRACFAGERIGSVRFGPVPPHPIGIWLGAYGPRMMRVTGRLADGWFPSLPRLPLDDVPGRMRLLEAAAERAGRDPRAIRRIANLSGVIEDGPVKAWLHGPPEHWIEELGSLRVDHGFDGFLFSSDAPMPEQIARFAAEVAPAVRRG